MLALRWIQDSKPNTFTFTESLATNRSKPTMVVRHKKLLRHLVSKCQMALVVKRVHPSNAEATQGKHKDATF